MEFDIETDNTSIFLQGQTTIELPSHYNTLPLAVIRQVKGYETVIIACGRITPDSDIDFMLGNGKLMSLSAKTFAIPHGKVVPIDGGKAIVFPEAKPVRLIDSISIIENASVLVDS
jgi:hypothetical protein